MEEPQQIETNRIEDLERNSHSYVQLVLDKGVKTYNGKDRQSLSTNSAGKLDTHVEPDPYLTLHKNELKIDQDLNIRLNALKLLEGKHFKIQA